MHNRILLVAFVLAAGACPALAAPKAITEADAAKMADATVVAWTSMDAAKIKALYAPTVNGFDYAVPGLSPDRATWDKRQDSFAAARIDKLEQVATAFRFSEVEHDHEAGH